VHAAACVKIKVRFLLEVVIYFVRKKEKNADIENKRKCGM